VTGAERAVAVFNALRSYLPELAALAANAPFHEGHDSEMASIRPKISEGLPRQGVPPPVADIDELAGALWELRLHPVLGTVEVRAPDQQTTVGETAAVAAVVHALVADLAARHDAGESLAVHPSWRIAENRWAAGRYGLAGTLADLDTGARQPTRERVMALLDRLGPRATDQGCDRELAGARLMALQNGAERQRAVAGEGDLRALVGWLADRFSPRADS
jgi:carboxylate-amine ligase